MGAAEHVADQPRGPLALLRGGGDGFRAPLGVGGTVFGRAVGVHGHGAHARTRRGMYVYA